MSEYNVTVSLRFGSYFEGQFSNAIVKLFCFSSSSLYSVVLGDHDRTKSEGTEQVIPVNRVLIVSIITKTRLFKFIENFTTEKGKFSNKIF